MTRSRTAPTEPGNSTGSRGRWLNASGRRPPPTSTSTRRSRMRSLAGPSEPMSARTAHHRTRQLRTSRRRPGPRSPGPSLHDTARRREQRARTSYIAAAWRGGRGAAWSTLMSAPWRCCGPILGRDDEDLEDFRGGLESRSRARFWGAISKSGRATACGGQVASDLRHPKSVTSRSTPALWRGCRRRSMCSPSGS